MRVPFIFTFLILMATFCTAQAAPPRPRPYSGSGVLLAAPQPDGTGARLVLYREPGLARIAELEAPLLPRLSGDERAPLLAVAGRKGGWTRIAYDEAGREGWLEQPRAWEFLTWDEFLAGRSVRVLPGMKKEFYLTRGEPGDRAAESGTVVRDQSVRVVRVEGDWARLEAPAAWFRWRDGDGRLTVAPLPEQKLEKR